MKNGTWELDRIYLEVPRGVAGDVAAGLGVVGVADATEGDVVVPGGQEAPVLHELCHLMGGGGGRAGGGGM